MLDQHGSLYRLTSGSVGHGSSAAGREAEIGEKGLPQFSYGGLQHLLHGMFPRFPSHSAASVRVILWIQHVQAKQGVLCAGLHFNRRVW